MKDKVILSNAHRGSQIKSLLLIDGTQIISSFMIGFLLLVVLNIPNIWRTATGGASVSTASQYFNNFLDQHAPWLYSTYGNISNGRAVQIFLWLLAGSVFYLLIWFVGSLVTNLRNDIVADNYLHPKFYNRVAFWLEVTSRKVIFALLCLILLIYIPIAAAFVIQMAGIVYDSLWSLGLFNNLFNLLASFLTSVALVHLFFILIRLVTNSWKLIYKDL